MNKIQRQSIISKIKYELENETYAMTLCKCKRQACRSEKCWECWLEDLE